MNFHLKLKKEKLKETKTPIQFLKKKTSVQQFPFDLVALYLKLEEIRSATAPTDDDYSSDDSEGASFKP